MKKYRILLVVRWPLGGIRTFLRYVYNNFDCNKYDFTLIAPELPEVKVLLEDLVKHEVKYIRLKATVNNKEFLWAVTKNICTNRYCLIHCHGFIAGFSSIFGSIVTNKPIILTCHDVFTEKQLVSTRGLVKNILISLILSMFDRIHCVSFDVKNNLLNYFRFHKLFERKLIVISNGINSEQYLNSSKRDLVNELSLPINSFLIGFLGRFIIQKGFKYLIESLEQLTRIYQLPKQPIVICVGESGGFIREEKENIRKRNLTDSFYFLPFVANIASTLKGLDVVVMPSLWEACPLLPMEAMVAGVPVIGTDCVGLREVLMNTPSIIVPAEDSIAITKALINEILYPSITKAGAFSVAAALRFDAKERSVELEQLMLELLEYRPCQKKQKLLTFENNND